MNYKRKVVPFMFALTLGLSPMAVYAAQQTHTVKSGETLWGVSQKFDVTINELKEWNKLNSSVLYIGQKLVIFPDSKVSETTEKIYTVKSGDTLYKIAIENNVTVANLKTWNNLKSDAISIGQKLSLQTKTTNPSTPNVDKPTSPTTPTVTNKTYTVMKGDTLYSIASSHKVTVNNIKTWNNLKSDGLFVGQKLTIKSTQSEGNINEETPQTTKTAVVNASVLNMRDGASTTSKLIGTLNKGDKVIVLEEKNGWSNIQYDNKKGWVSSEFLTIQKTESGNTEQTKKQYKVDATSLNLRKNPSTNDEILTAIPGGTIVSIIETKDGWSKLTYNGKIGWVTTSYLKEVTNGNTGNKGKVIVLDAGHGGNDPGAISSDGSQEREVTLQTTLKIQKELSQRGYSVVMVRTGNTSCAKTTDVSTELQCRVDLSKSSKADAFVSIHANANDNTSAYGTETYYSTGTSYEQSSLKLANNIHNNYQPAFGSSNRGVKTANYYVTKRNTVPSVLLEIGFITNSNDRSKLKSSAVQDKVAKGVADGIDKYFGY